MIPTFLAFLNLVINLVHTPLKVGAPNRCRDGIRGLALSNHPNVGLVFEHPPT